MRGHLAHGAERRVGGRAHEGVGNERAEGSSCAERKTGTQEKTRAERPGDLAKLSIQFCNRRKCTRDGEGVTGVRRPLWGCGMGNSQQSSEHGAA